MKLSKSTRKTLMLFLHQKIEEGAEYYSERIKKGEKEDLLSYPPNCGLTNLEEEALQKLKEDENLKTALRKLFADNSAGVVFELLNLFDGTIDPDEELGEMNEITIVETPEDYDIEEEMFHDEFYSLYWDWKEKRGNRGWELDL